MVHQAIGDSHQHQQLRKTVLSYLQRQGVAKPDGFQTMTLQQLKKWEAKLLIAILQKQRFTSPPSPSVPLQEFKRLLSISEGSNLSMAGTKAQYDLPIAKGAYRDQIMAFTQKYPKKISYQQTLSVLNNQHIRKHHLEQFFQELDNLIEKYDVTGIESLFEAICSFDVMRLPHDYTMRNVLSKIEELAGKIEEWQARRLSDWITRQVAHIFRQKYVQHRNAAMYNFLLRCKMNKIPLEKITDIPIPFANRRDSAQGVPPVFFQPLRTSSSQRQQRKPSPQPSPWWRRIFSRTTTKAQQPRQEQKKTSYHQLFADFLDHQFRVRIPPNKIQAWIDTNRTRLLLKIQKCLKKNKQIIGMIQI